jgi:hypothetical protein
MKLLTTSIAVPFTASRMIHHQQANNKCLDIPFFKSNWFSFFLLIQMLTEPGTGVRDERVWTAGNTILCAYVQYLWQTAEAGAELLVLLYAAHIHPAGKSNICAYICICVYTVRSQCISAQMYTTLFTCACCQRHTYRVSANEPCVSAQVYLCSFSERQSNSDTLHLCHSISWRIKQNMPSFSTHM